LRAFGRFEGTSVGGAGAAGEADTSWFIGDAGRASLQINQRWEIKNIFFFFLDFLFFYFSLFFWGKIEFSQSDLLIPFQSDENLIKIFD
jgi:hypothetical protein